MSRPFPYVVVALGLLLLAVPAPRSAPAVRLKPLPPIYIDSKGSGLKEPEAVACDGGSTLIVADTGNGRLLKYSVEGSQVTPAGEIKLPELPYPIQVQVDPKGGILALDGKLRKIARLSPAGEFKGYVEIKGETAPGPVVPKSFKIDGEGRLYVLDIFHSRILVAGGDGQLQRRIDYPADPGFISDLAVDSRETVYAVQSTGSRVFVARKGDAALGPLTGSMKEDMAFPVAIAADDQGHLFISDKEGSGIVILGSDGSFRGRQSEMGWKEGFLHYPIGLCTTGPGILFVADRGNNRIQPFAISE
jgi:hypothetical protein